MPEERKEFITRLPAELVEWLDGETGRWDRSRAWLIEHAITLWRKRLESSRERARRAAGK